MKVHADQLQDWGGAALAAEWQALSADHLEWSSADGIVALARAGTVAVLLPGAFFSLRERQHPPVAAIRAAGVPIALATDCNPGTSPLLSILTAMNMAAVQFGLTVQEVLAGVTREAARALGRLKEVGTLEAGKRANAPILQSGTWAVRSSSSIGSPATRCMPGSGEASEFADDIDDQGRPVT